MYFSNLCDILFIVEVGDVIMNRSKKIIIYITGILLITLILVGITYAYFLTKIKGNTNEKSISNSRIIKLIN